MSDHARVPTSPSRDRRRLLELMLQEEACGEVPPSHAAPDRDGTPPPLSFAQERLWVFDRLQPGNSLYTEPIMFRLQGPLQPQVLRRVLSEILRRHDALRTTFIGTEQPVPVVDPAHPVKLTTVDLGALPDPRRATEFRRLARWQGQESMDLARGPLVRVFLIRVREDQHFLLVIAHHIVFDGWSVGVFARELWRLYDAFRRGQSSPLPALPIQYSDFAVWQRKWAEGGEVEGHLAYWRKQLAGPLPTLDLPTDYARPVTRSFRGVGELFEIPSAVCSSLQALSKEQGVTLFMTLVAAFASVLHRYSGQTDILIGVPVAGRDRRDVENLMGCFVNMLALRTDLSGNPPFRTLLGRVRETCLGAFAHQDVPFERVVEAVRPGQNLAREPLFQVQINYMQNLISRVQHAGELTIESYTDDLHSSRHDMSLFLKQSSEGVSGLLECDGQLFHAASVARMVGHVQRLLDGVASNPDCRVSDLPLLTPQERRQLISGHPRPEAEPAPVCCVHHDFEEQVKRGADAVAVVFGEEAITYGELNRRANQLAHWLRAHGVRRESLVALCLDRSIDLIIGILGILKAGGAYVPLDPDYPVERLDFMLRDSHASVVVTLAAHAEKLAAHEQTTLLCLDRNREHLLRQPTADVKSAVSPGNLAYVIYTSGSTGTPKGTGVTHGNVARLFRSTEHWFRFNRRDVWLLFHSYAFDFSVWEVWGALAYGARLIVASYRISRSPRDVLDLLAEHQVTVLNQTPSAFQQLAQAEELLPSAPPNVLRYVIFGGEALDPQSLLPWYRRHGDRQPRLINMYGITETTVHVTYCPLSEASAVEPNRSLIGRPIPDLTLFILDSRLELVPIGVPGELYVGGEGLARGYLGRPGLTSQRFVPDPFDTRPGRVLYRTGDRARRLLDEGLDYLGRMDHQVKIRGFRIELGEVEAALNAEACIRQGVVAVHTGSDGEKALTAYLVPEPRTTIDLASIRRALERQLPAYMVPAGYVCLDAFPLTAQGKVDRRALPDSSGARPALDEDYEAPRDGLERALAQIFCHVLELEQVGVRDDFFALGGNSIRGIQVVNRIQEALGEIVHVVALFDAPNVAALGALLRERYPKAAGRLMGTASDAMNDPLDASDADAPIDQDAVNRIQSLVPPQSKSRRIEKKNPAALFILSPPRSGSTLLRIMLGGHPRLFAPPELELLSFEMLAHRREAFSGRDRFWLEGAIRAVMEARGCEVGKAEEIMEDWERNHPTTREFYGLLQSWLGERMLVDKTPSYGLSPIALQRAEDEFERPYYIHLKRHPGGMIHSFGQASLDQIFFRHEHGLAPTHLAEALWILSHQNILRFAQRVPAERWASLSFEELVARPRTVMQTVCSRLGIDYVPAMAEPYRDPEGRMTDGIHLESRMLGDVKFHGHQAIDPAVAGEWRRHFSESRLGALTWEVAAQLGYRPESVPAESVDSRRVVTPIERITVQDEDAWDPERLQALSDEEVQARLVDLLAEAELDLPDTARQQGEDRGSCL